MGVDVVPIRLIPYSSESEAASVFHSTFFTSIFPNSSPFLIFCVFSFASFSLLNPFKARVGSSSFSTASKETRTLEDLSDLIDLVLDKGPGSEVKLELIQGETDLARDENLVCPLPSASLSAVAVGSGWATIVGEAFFSAFPSRA